MDLKNVEKIIEVSEIIAGYLNGTLDQTGQDELLHWIHETEENRILFERLCNERNLTDAYALFQLFDDDAALIKVKRSTDFAAQGQSIQKRLWPRVAVAAAAVAAITLGVWFYTFRSDAGQDHVYAVHDIAPGKNIATLTLANGNVVDLSDAKTGVIVGTVLKYNDGTEVRTASTIPSAGQPSLTGGELVTAATPRGGTYQITLPDGTGVWLNADSKISFPSQFIGEKRRIILEGEAYFEVAKNKRKPFVVESRGQQVEVLGTHFNINAYNDEAAIKTTLLEGSVKVSTVPDRSSAKGVGGKVEILKPNQQSILTGYDRLLVTDVDVTEVIDWKNNEFRFNDADLKSIMRKVSRWYNIEVVYDGGVPLQKLDGVISRSRNISQVLKMLEKTGDVRFKVEGDKVFVRSNKK